MTKNELIELKKELIKNKDNYYYYKEWCRDGFKEAPKRFYAKEEIIEIEDTEGMAKKCVELIEDGTKYLTLIFGESLNQVALQGGHAPFLPAYILTSDSIGNTDSEEEIGKINASLLPNYVYVSYNLSEDNSYINDTLLLELYDKTSELNFDVKNIAKKCREEVSGIVKYNEFVDIMSKLGYKVQFHIGASAQTFEDYKLSYIDNGTLDIIVDFRKDKIKTKKI